MCQHNFGELYIGYIISIFAELLDAEKHTFRIMGYVFE